MSTFYDDDDNTDDWEIPPGWSKVTEGGEITAQVNAADMAVVMGRPVVMNEAEQAIANAQGIDLSDPYDGSVKMNCAACEREVWIGPKQQEQILIMSDVLVGCPTCCALAAAGSGTDASVINLGNVHQNGN